jgi:predicted SAM-dependent methyltransferase
MLKKIKTDIHIRFLQKFGRMNRITLAANYLRGEGLEIGAMNLPLHLKKGTRIKYLDRCSKVESEKIFPDFGGKLVDVDIIGDGETLDNIPDDAFDFIIGNHFIEHCQNPVFTIENMFRVIKPSGYVFMAIPDKRYTFDINRSITPTEHFIKDYEQSPAWSEEEHYYDFVKHASHGVNKNDTEIWEIVKQLKARNFSIHFHVWDHQAMIDMFCMIKKHFGFRFEIETAVASPVGGNESIFLLKKEK